MFPLSKLSNLFPENKNKRSRNIALSKAGIKVVISVAPSELIVSGVATPPVAPEVIQILLLQSISGRQESDNSIFMHIYVVNAVLKAVLKALLKYVGKLEVGSHRFGPNTLKACAST